MHMNVKPIPTLDSRINEIRALPRRSSNREILPNERKLWAGSRDGATDERSARRPGARGGRSRQKVKQRRASGRRISRRSTAVRASASSSTPT